MIYFELFSSFFQIGLMSIGGGYAAMSLIEQQVVTLNHWLSMQQFADIMTIAEMTPGPIAINAATFTGMQIAGLPGAVIATAGCIFPSCIIVTAMAWLYRRYRSLHAVQSVLSGLRPAVIAMIGSAALSLLFMALFNQRTLPHDLSSFDLINACLLVCALFLLRKKHLSPIRTMLLCGAAGMILHTVF